MYYMCAKRMVGEETRGCSLEPVWNRDFPMFFFSRTRMRAAYHYIKKKKRNEPLQTPPKLTPKISPYVLQAITLAAQSTNHSPDEPPTQFPPLDAATDRLAADQESLHANVSRQRKRGLR